MLFKPEELPISPGARARTFGEETGVRNLTGGNLKQMVIK